MTSGTYSPAEYEFMLRKYQSDLSVAKKTISTLQSELATARESAETVAASLGVAYKNRHVQIAVEDAKKTARSEALEEAALWFENPFYGYAMNGSIIAEHIRSLKPQPLNTPMENNILTQGEFDKETPELERMARRKDGVEFGAPLDRAFTSDEWLALLKEIPLHTCAITICRGVTDVILTMRGAEGELISGTDCVEALKRATLIAYLMQEQK